MNPAPPPAGCLACGACCFSQLPTYVRVSGADWSRLGERAEAVAHFIGHRAFMKMSGGHCAALEVRRGGYFCRVYADRPRVCRELERGSPECAAEREQKSARAAAAAGKVDITSR
jgi:hypothetical protein